MSRAKSPHVGPSNASIRRTNASDYKVSIPITIPEPTARDLELREAAAEMGRDHRFSGRALCRELGLTIEPKTKINVGHGFGGGI